MEPLTKLYNYLLLADGKGISYMKRIMLLTLAIAIALGIVACASFNSTDLSSDSNSESSTSLSVPEIEGDYEDRYEDDDDDRISFRIRDISSEQFVLDFYQIERDVAVIPLTGITCKIYNNNKNKNSIFFASDTLTVDNFDRSLFESSIGDGFDYDIYDTPDSYISALMDQLRDENAWFEGFININDHTIRLDSVEANNSITMCLAHKVDSANSLPTQYSGLNLPAQKSEGSDEDVSISDNNTLEEIVTEEVDATEGLIFEANDDGAYTVTGYEGNEVNIVIPDEHNGIPVTRIDEAFVESDIQSVVIGRNVKRVDGGFSGATLLRNVEIRSTEIEFFGGAGHKGEHVHPGAFDGCISLERVDFTNDQYNVNIEAFCFEFCHSLVSLDFSGAGRDSRISTEAFYECENLEELYVSSDFFCFFDPDIDYRHERSTVNETFFECDAEIIHR